MADQERTISMSRSGRFVALRRAGGIELVDALGTAPRHTLTVAGGAQDFACVGNTLWVLPRGAAAIDRYSFDGLRPIAPAIPVGAGVARITPAAGENAATALCTGDRPLLAHGLFDKVSIDELADADAAGAQVFPLHGRRILRAADDLRVIEIGRGEVSRMPRPESGPLVDAVSLFAGRAVALLIQGDLNWYFVVLRPTGGLVHKVSVPEAVRWVVAESRGLALLATDLHNVVAVDLRYGRVMAEGEAPIAIHDLAVDADGQFVAFAGAPETPGTTPPVLHLPYTDLVSAVGGARRAALRAVAEERAPAEHDDDDGRARRDRDDDDGDGNGARSGEHPLGHVLAGLATDVPADAADAEPLPEEPAPPPEPVVIPDLLPRAFGDDLQPMRIAARPGVPPYDSPREHIDELLDVVSARAARAIADAWNSGRLSIPSEDARPFEREVLAILGRTGDYARELLIEAEERLTRLTQRSAARATATIASGVSLPFVDLSREMALSSTAAQVLLVVVAPQIRGEIARLYGVLANDEHRPLVDRFLVELIVAGEDPRMRAEVAAELAPDAPLLRYGLVRHDGESPLFAALSVDPVLADRFRGRDTGTSSGVTTMRSATRSLVELHVPDTIKRELVLALAEPRRLEAPLRLVLRGRRGAGRHSLIAATAARVSRRVAAIDAGRLPRNAKLLAAGLRIELTRAFLRRAVPVVSGLETIDASDAEGQDLIKQVVRAHQGPVVIRATPEGALPLEPGYVTFTLPALSESERTEFWGEALHRAQLPVADVDGLAGRYRIGPGVIEQVIGEVAARRGHLGADEGDDAGTWINEAARQHIATRLNHVASHVARLARWEQVALPDDILDSLKEFIARIRHRRTVYERWGFDVKMTTSRGLSALFYGPPGTGKSMVAGLIARELGLELYRVDLARVVSKWIGETEKNLAEIFDAAEDGQVVILFDEADSLFAKRTEVKSSVDRYANLEVNYLLQRLDSFEGICILTTNLEGSIDPAFKRRMSLRLHFPFPDEEMRVRLWAAHVPPETPTAGDFDFIDLARRFPLSGGYIRNSALRAAFLAAQEECPLGQDHLIRAIQLEYRELGKLSTTGRME
jgi:ATPase family associated with various cellular activities (AAA)/Winged helix domain, variant